MGHISVLPQKEKKKSYYTKQWQQLFSVLSEILLQEIPNETICC